MIELNDIVKKTAIIVDIDGTIANAEHRLHFIKGDKKNWDKFFDEMVKDTYIEGSWDKIIEETAKYTEDWPFVIFLTGRRDTHRHETMSWIEKNIPATNSECTLIMRPKGDIREDTVLKRELYENRIVPFFDVLVAFEDRPRIIDMWKEMEVPVVQMGEWKEFEHASKT